MEGSLEIVKQEQAEPRERISASVILGFLLGQRSSIQRLLNSPNILWYATFLVFTAAVAREYDAVSLADRPWDLLGPFAASILLCTLIFALVNICLALAKRPSANLLADYKTFLSGYWLTAPLAWLYAVPIEIMADEVASLRFNLTALSIVSIWRVLLFSRVVSIIYALPFLYALAWVLAPCMAIAFYFLVSAILPMVSIMGGIRMTQTQAILFAYQNSVLAIIFYSAVPVIIVCLYGIVRIREVAKIGSETVQYVPQKMKRSMWLVPITALLALAGGAVFFQPRLWQAKRIDGLLNQGEFAAAIEKLEFSNRKDFPETWDPPPQFTRNARRVDSRAETSELDLSELLKALEQARPSIWINDLLLNQADEILFLQFGWEHGTENLEYLKQMLPSRDPGDLECLADSLRRLQNISTSNPEFAARAKELEEIVTTALTHSATKSSSD